MDARHEALALVRARFRERRSALYAQCKEEGGHEWHAERLHDFNLSHLQRHGSTPQSCMNCGAHRDVREYSELFTPTPEGQDDE
jgi:hypothetical protein